MQPASRNCEPSPASSSFAGLLAALTSGRTQSPEAETPPRKFWTDNLEDDVATLSYERALAHHARSRAEGISSASLGSGHGGQANRPDTVSDFRPAGPAPAPAQAMETAETEARIGATAPSQNRIELSRKRASITVRLTESEYAQLHQRANEAGMTVSAYLRSCTVEVEGLRAQVKQALAELRAASPGQAGPPAEHTAGWRWLGFLRRRL